MQLSRLLLSFLLVTHGWLPTGAAGLMRSPAPVSAAAIPNSWKQQALLLPLENIEHPLWLPGPALPYWRVAARVALATRIKTREQILLPLKSLPVGRWKKLSPARRRAQRLTDQSRFRRDARRTGRLPDGRRAPPIENVVPVTTFIHYGPGTQWHVDTEAIRYQLGQFQTNGVRFVAVLAEPDTRGLSEAQRREVIAVYSREAHARRMQVVTYVNGGDFEQTLRLARAAQEAAVDFIAWAPRGSENASDLAPHLEQFQAVGVKDNLLLVSESEKPLPPTVVGSAWESKAIIGIIDMSQQMEMLKRYVLTGAPVYQGNAQEIANALYWGAWGGLGAGGDRLPEMQQLVRSEDLLERAQLQHRLLAESAIASAPNGFGPGTTDDTKAIERGLYLAHPPSFHVLARLNYWMHLTDQPDAAQAEEEWQKLLALLKKRGIPIQSSDARDEKHVPDIIFAANAGIAFEMDGVKYFVPSRFKWAERENEEPLYEAYLKSMGYHLLFLFDDKEVQEGEGDLFFHGGRILAGVGRGRWFRSEAEAHEKIARFTGLPLQLLNLVDPRFYHLDTALAFLNENVAIYYPGAFDAPSRAALQRHMDLVGGTLIPVKLEDALQFALNAIPLGKNVVMHEGVSLELEEDLNAAGITLLRTPMAAFIKGGGSTKCSVMFLIAMQRLGAWHWTLARERSRVLEWRNPSLVTGSPPPLRQALSKFKTNRVRQLYELTKPFLRRTPLVFASALTNSLRHFVNNGAVDVYIKDESEQMTGSYKPRGVLADVLTQALRIYDMEGAESLAQTEFVTESTGNHGGALAWAVHEVLPRFMKSQRGYEGPCGVAKVFIPANGDGMAGISAIKLRQLTETYHAKIIDHDPVTGVPFQNYEAAREAVFAYRASITQHPVFHVQHDSPDVMAGHGGLVLEVVEDLKRVHPEWFENGQLCERVAVVVPMGSGGASAGAILAMEEISRNLSIIPVQGEDVAGGVASLRTGKMVPNKNLAGHRTFYDGTEVDSLGSRAFSILQRGAEKAFELPNVGVAPALKAMVDAVDHPLEGSSALTAELLQLRPEEFAGYRAVILIATGGKVDAEIYQHLMKHVNGFAHSPIKPAQVAVPFTRAPGTIQGTFIGKRTGRGMFDFMEFEGIADYRTLSPVVHIWIETLYQDLRNDCVQAVATLNKVTGRWRATVLVSNKPAASRLIRATISESRQERTGGLWGESVRETWKTLGQIIIHDHPASRSIHYPPYLGGAA